MDLFSLSSLLANSLQYSWDFGDQSSIAYGASSSHTYNVAGIYAMTLTITSATGQRSMREILTVSDNAPFYPIPYRWDGSPGVNSPNYAVTLPTANDDLTDAIAGSPIIPVPTITLVSTNHVRNQSLLSLKDSFTSTLS
ncbi:MAG: PKD domain-containing protein [Ktedonobacteraceae bacterium]